MSQCKLAEKSGLHRTYINTVESGRRNITVENLKRIADALGVEIGEFFNHEEIVKKAKRLKRNLNERFNQ